MLDGQMLAKYLDTLSGRSGRCALDIIMPGSAEYHTAIDQAVTGDGGYGGR